MIAIRTCSRCRNAKPASEFYTQGLRRYKSQLLGGWCKSCKCMDEQRRRADPSHVATVHAKYETDMRFRSRELIRAIGKRSRQEGVECDLDVSWLQDKLESGRCELTGLPFNFSVATRRRNSHTPSVDRILAGGGYVKTNYRVVLYAVNTAINDWGLAVALEIAEALVASQSRKETA